MRFQLYLLFAVIAACSAKDPLAAKFYTEFLRPDLEEIAQYYEKGGTIQTAYIQIYDSMVLRVELEHNGYLRVDGRFAVKSYKKKKFPSVYFKKGDLYILDDKQSYTKIQEDDAVLLVPEKIPTTKPCLFIRYADLKEIEEDAGEFYKHYKEYINTALDASPAPFVAAHPTGPFVEYSYLSRNLVESTSSIVHVIAAEVRQGYLSMEIKTKKGNLVYDQKERVCKVLGPNRQPIPNVLSVRTAYEAFLAEEKLGGEVNMLSVSDLYMNDPLPMSPFVSDDELLHKSKFVEPRISVATAQGFPPANWITGVRFQVHGNLFMKYLNIQGNTVDMACPYIITSESEQPIILFNGNAVAKVCANDEKIISA